MVEYTLFEKIKTLTMLLSNAPLFLFLLFGVLVMAIDAFIISPKETKTKKIYAVVTVFLFILFLEPNLSLFIHIIDNYGKNVVNIFYFPSITQYSSALIITTLIFFIGIKAKVKSKVLKIINTVMVVLSSIMLLIVLEEINSSKIDFLNKLELYNNSTLMILFQLTVLLFIIMLIINGIYYIVNYLTSDKSKKEDRDIIVKEKIVFKEKPQDIYPSYKEGKIQKITNVKDLNNEPKMPKLKKEHKEFKDITKDFTLEEYKTLKNILKDNKKK